MVLAAYANAFQGAYQFDDYRVIVDNPAVSSLSAWWQDMPGIRPLLKLSFALTGQLSADTQRFVLHAGNVLVHGMNAVLLLRILRQLGTSQRGADAAFLAALLFAAHPINSEAVTYLSGRSMSLMGLFYLLSVRTHLARRTGWSLLAFVAALAVRETAITLPLALLIIDRQRDPTRGWRSLFLQSQGHWLVAVAGLLALVALPYARYLAEVSVHTRSVTDNLVTQAGGVLYLGMQLLRPTGLNADPVLPVFSYWSWFWIGQVLVVMLCLAWALGVWLSPRTPFRQGTMGWLAFGLVWFFLHLVPTNSVLPRLAVANERHLYLAAIGLYLALAYALAGVRHGRWLGVGLALALALATHGRNQVYGSELTFWQDVLRHDAANVRALNNLGLAYGQAGAAEQALACYDRGLALAPRDFNLYFNRRALCRQYPTRLAGRC